MKNPYKFPVPVCRHPKRKRKWDGYTETCGKCGVVTSARPLPPKTWTPEPINPDPYGPDHLATIHEISRVNRRDAFSTDPDRTTRKES